MQLLIFAIALVLRLWGLDWKPPHFDEGINGWFADRIRTQGFYAYDPTNYHGPLYFYVLFLFQTLFGRNLWALRMPAVLGSLTTVWLAFRFDRFLGKNVARWGALALALSPAMVFYGRYAIHEAWVVPSLMIVVLGIFGLWTQGDRRSLFVTITGITLLILLKETAVIHFSSLLLVTTILLLWRRFLLSRHEFDDASFLKISFSGIILANQTWHYRDLCSGLLAATATIFFFYSGGLKHLHGFLDLFSTLSAWMHTGMKSSGHLKSEYQWGLVNFYWIALMARYEVASLIGLLYGFWLLWRSSKLVRFFCHRSGSSKKALPFEEKVSPFPATAINQDEMCGLAHYLAIYAIGVLIFYSVIPYKTPWCIISIIWPFALLFGVFLEKLSNKKIACLVAGVVLGASFFCCVRLNFWHYADFSEPYVYVQTSPEIRRLTGPLLAMAKRDPRNLKLRGQIILESYYPLPWMLGDFKAIGYYSKKKFPQKLDADFIVVSKTERTKVESRLRVPYYYEEFQLRDAMEKCVVYFKKTTFESFFSGEHPSLNLLNPTP